MTLRVPAPVGGRRHDHGLDTGTVVVPPLSGRTAVVTGASQGIGRAIARRLAEDGAGVILGARRVDLLEEVRGEIEGSGGRAWAIGLDLGDAGAIGRFCDSAEAATGDVDILVNCGGTYARGAWTEATVADLEEQLDINVRGTYALTRSLIPKIIARNGDVVFVNSSVVDSDGKGVGHFSATQHALVGLANALRAEVNAEGVRVLSIHPGRTATPRQREIFRTEERGYVPEALLQPSDVASAIAACLALPATAEITELKIRPRHPP